MQAAVPIPDLPSAQMLGLALLMFIAGMAVPTRYGLERLNGFGRFMASKLPYQAPPGKEEAEAMVEAVEDVDGQSQDIGERGQS